MSFRAEAAKSLDMGDLGGKAVIKVSLTIQALNVARTDIPDVSVICIGYALTTRRFHTIKWALP